MHDCLFLPVRCFVSDLAIAGRDRLALPNIIHSWRARHTRFTPCASLQPLGPCLVCFSPYEEKVLLSITHSRSVLHHLSLSLTWVWALSLWRFFLSFLRSRLKKNSRIFLSAPFSVIFLSVKSQKLSKVQLRIFILLKKRSYAKEPILHRM